MKTNQIELTKSNGSIFTAVVKGKNFMTPYLIGYYKVTDGEAELTEGDFMGDDIYGVTVVKNGVQECELSKICDSRNEAIDYILSLNN